MSTETIRENLVSLRQSIEDSARNAGRDPATVHLVAVSKTKPVELIRRAYDAGQRVFGENRVQELTAKAPVLPADCEWHLIGPLQRNKVRAAVRHAAYIHSVDSRQLIARIDRIAAEENVQPRILLQINALGE